MLILKPDTRISYLHEGFYSNVLICSVQPPNITVRRQPMPGMPDKALEPFTIPLKDTGPEVWGPRPGEGGEWKRHLEDWKAQIAGGEYTHED